MICNKCGKNNPAGTQLCPSCGEEMPGSVNCGGFADILTYTPPESPKEEAPAVMAPVASAPAAAPGMSESQAVRLADKIKLSIILSLTAAGICLLSLIIVLMSNSNISAVKDIASGIEINEQESEQQTQDKELEKDSKKDSDKKVDEENSDSDAVVNGIITGVNELNVR